MRLKNLLNAVINSYSGMYITTRGCIQSLQSCCLWWESA